MDETTTIQDSSLARSEQPMPDEIPVLLVASSPEGTLGTDCCRVTASFTIGRTTNCNLTIQDGKISREHCVIKKRKHGFEIKDLNSKNHTYLQGCAIEEPQRLENQSVVRVGRTLLVFHEQGGPLIDPPPAERFGMAGRFHVGPTIQELREAALSARHCLVAGRSGSGKELAANALAVLMAQAARTGGKIVSHNAARFASEEEAATTLFGVGPRVFSGVDARAGLIEEAKDGVLFLDEAHCLPERIQKSLLRVIEENKSARIGETVEREVAVRIVLASNLTPPLYGLAPDLRARLRVIPISPLSKRIADIPAIFLYLLSKTLRRLDLDEVAVQQAIRVHHFEQMLLYGFKEDNVRGLVDLADKIATRIAAGFSYAEAASTVVAERFGRNSFKTPSKILDDQTASHYQLNKSRIIAAYEMKNYNLSATERHLRDEGIQCSRRWIRHYLKEWTVYRSREGRS